MTDKIEIKHNEEFEALHALYENKQQWVRHYEAILGQLNPVSTTVSLAIAAYIADNSKGNFTDNIFLIIPVVLICFTLWFNWWCDGEIKRQFDQIVLAEVGMGFYTFLVEGKQILPDSYRQSPNKTRPIIISGYMLQLISILVVIAAFVKLAFA